MGDLARLLNESGRAILGEMDRVGMIKCCSHTGYRTAREVLTGCGLHVEAAAARSPDAALLAVPAPHGRPTALVLRFEAQSAEKLKEYRAIVEPFFQRAKQGALPALPVGHDACRAG